METSVDASEMLVRRTPAPEPLRAHLNPVRLALNLWKHRHLLFRFTRREIEGRYRGSVFGILWSIVNPVVSLVIYTFVFGVVLKTRWPNSGDGGLGYFALVMFCGLTPFNVLAECANRAAGIMLAVPSYVRKVVFPLEILPVAILGSALFHFHVALGIIIGAQLLRGGHLCWAMALLPVVLLPLVFLCLGVSWFLASLGVFVRDLPHVTALAVQVLLFMTPIFYPIEAVPEQYRFLIRMNPLTTVVESVRRIVLQATVPDWAQFFLWLAISALIMIAGYIWFMKTRRLFADAI